MPPTVDQEALRQHVNLVNVDLIPEGGTHLGEAIDAAMEAFEGHEQDSHKVLVLFSDGEDHDENALAKAEEAAQKGLRIFTIGAGTPDGELIPVNYCPSCESPNQPGRSRCRITTPTSRPAKSLFAMKTAMLFEAGSMNPCWRNWLNSPWFYLRLEGAQTMDVLTKWTRAAVKSENNSTMLAPT